MLHVKPLGKGVPKYIKIADTSAAALEAAKTVNFTNTGNTIFIAFSENTTNRVQYIVTWGLSVAKGGTGAPTPETPNPGTETTGMTFFTEGAEGGQHAKICLRAEEVDEVKVFSDDATLGEADVCVYKE